MSKDPETWEDEEIETGIDETGELCPGCLNPWDDCTCSLLTYDNQWPIPITDPTEY